MFLSHVVDNSLRSVLEGLNAFYLLTGHLILLPRLQTCINYLFEHKCVEYLLKCASKPPSYAQGRNVKC